MQQPLLLRLGSAAKGMSEVMGDIAKNGPTDLPLGEPDFQRWMATLAVELEIASTMIKFLSEAPPFLPKNAQVQ